MFSHLEDLQEWHWREFCTAAGLQVPWRDVREHCVAVDRMSPTARAAWVADNELQAERELAANDQHTRRRVERSLARAVRTEAGRIISEHDVRASATLQFWMTRSVLGAE